MVRKIDAFNQSPWVEVMVSRLTMLRDVNQPPQLPSPVPAQIPV
jgi:hypothetical protein